MIQVDSDFTYLVKVGWDKTFKVHNISLMPTKDLVTHEFPCKKSFNEYMNLLKSVNDDKMGKFLWHCWERPISKSKIYKKQKQVFI
jgi:hypothetical protein